MATRTGKTRTIMVLIDVLLRSRQAQKILFLADRDSLVDQAMTKGFKAHIPTESRERIRTYHLDDPEDFNSSGRAFVNWYSLTPIGALTPCSEYFTTVLFGVLQSSTQKTIQKYQIPYSTSSYLPKLLARHRNSLLSLFRTFQRFFNCYL